MQVSNGIHLEDHPVIAAQLDALKSRAKRIYGRAMTTPAGEPTRFRVMSTKLTAAIQAHPIAAVAIAFTAGYVVVRIARR